MPYTPPYRRNPEKPKHDRFDKITLSVAIVGVIVIAVSAGISAWQAIIFHQQIEVMESQNRPWLRVDSLYVNPEFVGILFKKNGDISVLPSVKVTNVGQSAAISAAADVRLVAYDSVTNGTGYFDVINNETGYCNFMRKKEKTSSEAVGDIIFPTQVDDLATGAFWDLTVKPDYARHYYVSIGKRQYIRLAAVGCVAYRVARYDQVFQTRFAYIIHMRGSASDLIPIGTNIAAQDIVFEPFADGNGYAD